jgi:pimeloyl-ACP methyl ester carboxylesterase
VRFKRYFMAILLLTVLLSACRTTTSPVPDPEPLVAELPRFETDSCPFDLPANLSPEDVRCGFVVVPETRDTDTDTDRTLKLATLVVKARSGNSGEVASIYLQGGPGGDVQGVILGLQNESYLAAFAGETDFIVFDQRGVGQSQPALLCPNTSDAETRLQQRVSLMSQHTDAIIDSVVASHLACRDALLAADINLAAFNTRENAADIADIAKVLGYEQLNVWGGSYGAQLALRVMLDFPEIVRAVDLEAVIAPQLNWVARAPLAFDRARLELFAACANDDRCASTYPDLEQVFDALIDDLNATQPIIDITLPGSGEPVQVRADGNTFLSIFNRLLYSPDILPILPLYTFITASGNLEPFGQYLASILFDESTFSFGMYLTVVCSDVAPFTSVSDHNEILSQVTERYRDNLALISLPLIKTCREWGVPADPQSLLPVRSDIPTLLQVGFFDPITPPLYAETVAEDLSNATFVAYPAGSHGATLSTPAGVCGQQIMAQFFRDPGAPLDTRCASEPLSFIYPEDLSVQGVSPLLPETLPRLPFPF